MKIQILGTGCPKCKELARRTEEAVQKLGLDAPVEKVTQIDEIMKFGILMTPALAIDGAVTVAGKVPSAAEIQTILTSHMS